MLGETGTEQFTIRIYLDDKKISEQKLHDPFIRTTVKAKMSRWEHFKAIFKPPEAKVVICVDGSEGVIRRIMMLDAEELAKETEAILAERALQRESGAYAHNYVSEKA